MILQVLQYVLVLGRLSRLTGQSDDRSLMVASMIQPYIDDPTIREDLLKS